MASQAGASLGLQKDERLGLAVAIGLHVAVVAAMLVRTDGPDAIKPPERIEVTISDEVGMTSMSPDPFSQAAPDRGPELGEAAPLSAPVPEIAPAPSPLPEQPAPRPVERAEPAPAPKPAPRATARPEPKPSPRPEPKPAPKQTSRRSSAIDDIVSKPSPKPAAPAKKAQSAPKKSGSSAFADAFSDGVSGAKAESGSGSPAAEIGPRERSALGASINRQLKPHWQAPQGADAELLITRVRFRLNKDGSLDGAPEVISTSGKTAANAAQVQRHQEQAIRAVRLAAPFNLPEDLYAGWKVVTTNFDRRLSQ